MEGFERSLQPPHLPLGREDYELLWAGLPVWGHLRQEYPARVPGDIQYRAAQGPLLAFYPLPGGGDAFWPPLMPEMTPVELRLEDEERIELLLGGGPLSNFGSGPRAHSCLLTLEVCCDCL